MTTSKNVAIAVLSMSLIGSSMLTNEFYNKNKLVYNKLHKQESTNHQLLDEQTKLNLLIKKQDEATNKLQKTIKAKNEDIHRLQKQLVKAKVRNESPSRRKVKKVVKAKPVQHTTTSQGTYYKVTAYTANAESTGKSPGDNGYRVTASGTNVQEGRTVACPKSLSFGTKIYIDKVGYRICQDRGSAITQNRLDLYVQSLQAAEEFGVKMLKVKILGR